MVHQGNCRPRISVRRVAEISVWPRKSRPARATFAEMAKEENAAMLPLRQAGELFKQRKSFCGLMEIHAEVSVEGIEYQQAGMGSLERVFDYGGIAQFQGGRGHGADSAQDRETFQGHPGAQQSEGRMISELLCSIEAYKTVQGSSASQVHGSRPRLRAAAMASAIQVFPEPGTPEIMAKVPHASLSCHSHSTGRGSRSQR